MSLPKIGKKSYIVVGKDDGMKKRNILFLAFLLYSTLFTIRVNAESIYYKNGNGVILSEQEYDFYSEFYWDGYQEYLTIEDFEKVKDMNIFDKEITKKEIINYSPVKERGSSVTSNLRTTTISKSCSDKCLVSLVTSWNGLPYVKSYDVVGARVSNSNITYIQGALVTGNNYGKSYSNPQVSNNGFGFSVLLPNVSNIRISVTFNTAKGGTVYGSYQHAMSNTTEFISKQYTIGAGEYGNVFRFTGNARMVYDNAAGVDIALN